MNKTEKIAQLNDQFRSSFLGGKVLLTCGVNEHPLREQVITAVRTFDEFTEGDDPHGEHDFGAVEIEGETFFWKIDYYDETMNYLSTDPADPTITNRVMTIMRADEY